MESQVNVKRCDRQTSDGWGVPHAASSDHGETEGCGQYQESFGVGGGDTCTRKTMHGFSPFEEHRSDRDAEDTANLSCIADHH